MKNVIGFESEVVHEASQRRGTVIQCCKWHDIVSVRWSNGQEEDNVRVDELKPYIIQRT
jgi:hypothetical protein